VVDRDRAPQAVSRHRSQSANVSVLLQDLQTNARQ
jgi:hypothetical protein